MTARWSGAARLTAWAWFAALLGCTALGAIVDSWGFLFVGAFAGALVATTGAVCRLAHLPAPVIVPLQLLVLLEWLTFTYARAEAWAGLVPTAASTARLGDLVGEALDLARETVPPAPVNTAAVACLATIVALVVLVVDLVAVTWRRPALVGLVFLGVYMAPVSLLAGNVPAMAFIPGALGYVFLLAAEQRDRLSHWGRQISSVGSLLARTDRSTPTVTSLISAGRRVGFGAVALAVVLPLLIPTLPRTLLGDGPLNADGGTGVGGDGSVAVDNPMLDLKRNLEGQSDAVLLTFSTDDPHPGYLRLAALDTFSENTWHPGARPDETSLQLGQSPVVPGLNTQVARQRFDYHVGFTQDFESRWLPTVYPVTDVRADGDWGIDTVQLDVSARGSGLATGGTRYSFSSLQLDPTLAQFDASTDIPPGLQPFVALPADLPSVVPDLAREVTSAAQTPLDRALALQHWFRVGGGFRYSLDRQPGDGLETIQEFLSGSRTGYCEQFAASMALMARSLGIPARVAVGFLRPERVDADSYTYRGTDMHAWPELYFAGVGWLRFEPTPGVRTGPAPHYEIGAGGPGPTASGTDPSSTQSSVDPTRSAAGDVSAAADASGGGGSGPPMAAWLGIGLLVLGLALAPRLLRAAVRRRRWARAAAGAAEPAWQELRDSTVDLGLPFDDRATLRIAGRGLRTHLAGRGDAVDALNRLVVGVERSRFARAAGGEDAATAAQQARADVQQVLAALAAGRNRRRLLRATWFPLSLLRRVRSGGSGHWWSGRSVIGPDGAVVQVEGTATR